jgi:hypothetical protein
VIPCRCHNRLDCPLKGRGPKPPPCGWCGDCLACELRDMRLRINERRRATRARLRKAGELPWGRCA